MKTLSTTTLVILLFIGLSFSAKAHTLPATYTFSDASFSIQNLVVKHNSEKKVNTINWETQNKDVNYFIVESSTNGNDFKTIGYVFAGDVENYSFRNVADSKTIYKVKAINKDDVVISVCTKS